MTKRLLCLMLALAMMAAVLPGVALPASAATQSPNSPYAMIEYGYSGTVTCGTVRYISQVSYDSYFYSSYWPSGTFGYYTGASVECGTASMSMSLSYIGVNKTPSDILYANNGATVFGYGWGGSTYVSYSASNLSGAMDKYINGGGKYSPPVIHIPGYSAAGHYVVVVGQISSNTYQILDPWQRACTSMTVNGTSAVYTTYKTFYDNIDQIHQWYNPNASINNDVKVTFDANGGSCSTTSKSVSSGTAIVTLPTPTRSGYRFVGWYTSRNSGADPISDATVIKDATTCYAHWTSIGSTAGNRITFNANGGTLPGASLTLTATGTNIYRNTDNLIVFNCDGQTVDSNFYGTEIAVDSTGKVVDKRPYQSMDKLTVPRGGFVLSGHGNNTGMCTTVASIRLGSYVTFDESTMTVRVYSDKDAYLSALKYVASGSTYGELPLPTNGTTPFLGWYTADGTQITDTSIYCASTLYAQWGCDHSYSVTKIPAPCGGYPTVKYSCSKCGKSATYYDDSVCSDWSETKPAGMVESKTQYACRDYVTKESANASEPGYTQSGCELGYIGATVTNYASSWPSGFNTNHSMYTQYNNSKLTASETATEKTVISSDRHVGYLYFHWCDTSVTSSYGYQTGVYNTFHVYYDTTSPDNYACDTSDYSYKTSHSSCSNSNWWFPVDIYSQTAVRYSKLYLHEGWSDWSEWSDLPMVGTATRQVKTRTVYHTIIQAPQTHTWSNGVCTGCGSPCAHIWSGEICRTCGMTCPHSWRSGVCTTCGSVCRHSYSGGKCSVCGEAEPRQELYLFGHINGASYGYQDDYANVGQYLFTDGKLVATFATDSHVGVKTADNRTLYMTNGYLGTNVSSATMYPSTVLSSPDLLYVPGGVEVTFTLTENADGSITLSYRPGVTLTPKYPTLSFEDEVFINVYFTASNANAADMGLLTWSTAKAEGTIDNADAVIPGAGYNSKTGFYCVRTNGIPAKNLGDTVYFKIYIRLSDGSYLYSKLLNYSPKTYANSLLSTGTAKQKALVVAMLNYGAAAQTFFSYKPYSLMNAGLTTAQKALVSPYSPGMMDGIGQVPASKLGIFAGSGGFTRKYPTISFEGAFSINYYFVPSNTPQGSVRMYYWTQEDFDAATTLTAANATGCIVMNATNGTYQAVVDGIAAKDLDSTIYISAGYVSNGVSYCTGVLAYSIGGYCVTQANTAGDMQPFARATAVYGYYAKQYFG